MKEHPVKQKIIYVDVGDMGEGNEVYEIGKRGCTRIEACEKSGMHANIPYIRVWNNDLCMAELCQHNIIGIYFATNT